MRGRARHVRDDCRLPVAMLCHRQSQQLAHGRIAAVGGQQQRAANAAAVTELDRDVPGLDAERLLAASEADFLAELTVASAGALGDLIACSARAGFPLRAIHAMRYTAPRVALIGDAAHTVHPLAGQGMNLGLLDAAAVAAVVEDALLAGEDPGDLKVLQRYERQRKGDNLAMLTAFDALNRLFRLPPAVAPLRALGLRAVDSAHPVKRMLMRHALGLRSGTDGDPRWSHADSQA
jgi:2-octaprenylphenol hydroxylase